MKQVHPTDAIKRPYSTPTLYTHCVAPMQMLAISGDPEVHTTSDPADTDYDALTKENRSDNVWDDDWSE